MVSETALIAPLNQERYPAADGNNRGSDFIDPLCLFAGGIAHDFNNLLTVINGYCQLLLSEKSDVGKFPAYAREIFRAGEKAAEIVEMVLAYGGRKSMQQETFEVTPLLEGMRGFLTLFLGKSISLGLRLCRQNCRVCGDSGQLQWALMNLLMNSKEAMPEGGCIDLETVFIREADPERAEPQSGTAHIEISVRDTGHGMSKEVLDRIFDPYFSTKNRSKALGQGLGLACTKGIVRQLGGRIDAESTPGAGTLIRIRLPVSVLP